jgi:phosphate starvation-inducible protein PhoH
MELQQLPACDVSAMQRSETVATRAGDVAFEATVAVVGEVRQIDIPRGAAALRTAVMCQFPIQRT